MFVWSRYGNSTELVRFGIYSRYKYLAPKNYFFETHELILVGIKTLNRTKKWGVGAHRTEVAPLTPQQPQVQFSAFPKNVTFEVTEIY